MNAPGYVTLTGIDAGTDLDRVRRISLRHHVEWAVLLSPDRQGSDPRYPSLDVVEAFSALPVAKAAHLCGQHARKVVAGEWPDVLLGNFDRIQVNHRHPDAEAIAAFAATKGARGIMQVRDDAFPEVDAVDMLFDRSGGLGKAPASWPAHPGRRVGYAGGMSPDNVVDAIKAIGASGSYWIDMETGVRTDDRFDLDKCEAVLRAVYGD